MIELELSMREIFPCMSYKSGFELLNSPERGRFEVTPIDG